MSEKHFNHNVEPRIFTHVAVVHLTSPARSNIPQTRATRSAPGGHSAEIAVCGIRLDQIGLQTPSDDFAAAGS
jgi:hypothetical protein